MERVTARSTERINIHRTRLRREKEREGQKEGEIADLRNPGAGVYRGKRNSASLLRLFRGDIRRAEGEEDDDTEEGKSAVVKG